MGYYRWWPDGCMGLEEEEAMHQQPLLHLTQVLPAKLAPRLHLFPWPLPAAEGADALLQQLTPGFQDAPGVCVCVCVCVCMTVRPCAAC